MYFMRLPRPRQNLTMLIFPELSMVYEFVHACSTVASSRELLWLRVRLLCWGVVAKSMLYELV